MPTIRRLTDSALLVTTDDSATLFDPGFHTFTTEEFDLGTVGDVTRVLISHEHLDHAHPGFVRWLKERRADLTIHSNTAVAEIFAKEGLEVSVEAPPGVNYEDVVHERVPSGATPPNRAFTIDGLITHPGDSRQPTTTAPILALPLMVPWDSATGAVDFARRLRPSQVVAVHDFYLTKAGRDWIRGMIQSVLAPDGIEMVDLDWGESFTV